MTGGGRRAESRAEEPCLRANRNGLTDENKRESARALYPRCFNIISRLMIVYCRAKLPAGAGPTACRKVNISTVRRRFVFVFRIKGRVRFMPAVIEEVSGGSRPLSERRKNPVSESSGVTLDQPVGKFRRKKNHNQIQRDLPKNCHVFVVQEICLPNIQTI